MKQDGDKTIVAIDYGERRVGLAKCDPTGLIASALTTLEVRSRRDAVEQLRGIIEEHQPQALVIGYPLLASGDKSDKCRQVDRFVEHLREVFEGPVYLVDERHSSQEAASIIHAHGKRTGRDKKRIDRLAAVIILQRFLDERTV